MLSVPQCRHVSVCVRPAVATPQVAASSTATARQRPTASVAASPQPPSCATPVRRPRLGAIRTPAVGQAVAAAGVSKHALHGVAYEMATMWHFPWRTYHIWPKRLLKVAQSWMSGDLAAGRRTQVLTFCSILLGIQDHDTTPDHRNFAAFVLLWAQSVQQAATHPEKIEGAETADALDAVGAYMALVRTQYAQVFRPGVTGSITQAAKRIMVYARQMRGCALTK
jgi:hypothetical protein